MRRDWSSEQVETCKYYQCEFLDTYRNSKLGLALGTLGKLPVNGLRHSPNKSTCGRFIWCGTELSEDPNFFAPMHVAHLEEKCPEVLRFLGLPAGYRFLLATDSVDVWYDPKLLRI